MNPYLRNLLILTLIGTVNFFVFMFMSGRTALFLGRTPTAVKIESNVGLDSSQKKTHIEEQIRRTGSVNIVQMPSVKEPIRVQENSSDIEVGFIFKSSTNISVIKHVEPTRDTKDRILSSTFINATSTVQNKTTEVHDVHNMQPPVNNVLMLYNRDDSNHINPHSYKLILDEPHACFDASGSTKEVFLLVLISTIHKNFEQRHAIRETWGSPREVDGKKVVTLFMLAFNGDAHLQRQVEEECSEHHDLLQEDFKDTYKNLTLKTIMGMKWTSSHCPHASYVMKTDDDMYVSYANLVKHLAATKTPTTNYGVGFLINGGPIRDPKSKWFMPKEIYPETRYPPFLSGTGYVFSCDLAGKIYEKSLDIKYLYLEDVFVAVCLKALNVIPVKNKNFNNWRTTYSYCRFSKLITTHMVSPSEMHRIWKDQLRKRSVVC